MELEADSVRVFVSDLFRAISFFRDALRLRLDVFDEVHGSSAIGWAVHGSRYSGGAAERQDAYVALARMLLAAGAALHYPEEPGGDAYRRRLIEDASPRVREVLESEVQER